MKQNALDNPNLCEKCHAKHGCGSVHDVYLSDTGICGSCGEINDVWDCDLCKLYAGFGLSVENVWKSFPRLRNFHGESVKNLEEIRETVRAFMEKPPVSGS